MINKKLLKKNVNLQKDSNKIKNIKYNNRTLKKNSKLLRKKKITLEVSIGLLKRMSKSKKGVNKSGQIKLQILKIVL